jgi:hypothetical protein
MVRDTWSIKLRDFQSRLFQENILQTLVKAEKDFREMP